MTNRFGNFTAISNLNLEIQGTKCVGFLGPNGAGKTTKMKMFTDLITVTSGSALINGVDIRSDKPAICLRQRNCSNLNSTLRVRVRVRRRGLRVRGKVKEFLLTVG